MAITLTNEEREWRDELSRQSKDFPLDADYEARIRALSAMRDLAVKLHNSLKQRGHEPRHHRYMIENRGIAPDNPEFYFHIHPVEDLIKFTYDEHANDDPVDQTIDVEFEFRVFSRRWGHDDIYKLTRTAHGWILKANIYSGPCDKSGKPLVFECLRHDSVQYPSNLADWFEWLWDQAKARGLSRDAVQGGLHDLSRWIHTTEETAPRNGIWEGLA